MEKKRLFIGVGVPLIVVIVVIVVVFSGPRVEIDTTLHPVDLPEDLDAYLVKSEAAFNDIVPGAEKTIVWAGERGVRTPLSIVNIHGFSACRQETAPVSDLVAQELGANLFYTRLAGHGRGSDAMLDGSVNAWLNDAREALEIGKKLGDEVVIIGVSTGGAAATWLTAQSTSEPIAALILISPNYGPADERSRILLWPWGETLAEYLIGPERSWEPPNELTEKYWTTRYPTPSLLPMMGMVKLGSEVDFASLQEPTLMIYSPDDQTVNPDTIVEAFDQWGSKRKELVRFTDSEDPGQHVLAGDIRSPSTTTPVAEMIVDFIRGL